MQLEVLFKLLVYTWSINAAEFSVILVGRDTNCTEPLLVALSTKFRQLVFVSYFMRSWLKSPTIYDNFWFLVWRWIFCKTVLKNVLNFSGFPEGERYTLPIICFLLLPLQFFNFTNWNSPQVFSGLGFGLNGSILSYRCFIYLSRNDMHCVLNTEKDCKRAVFEVTLISVS